MDSTSSGLKHFKIMISLAKYTQLNKGTPLRMNNDNKYTYYSAFVLFQMYAVHIYISILDIFSIENTCNGLEHWKIFTILGQKLRICFVLELNKN